MADDTEHALELKDDQLAYLVEMAEKHGLPDASKALRCLVNFAREKADLEDDIFAEIRCTNC